MKTLRFGRTISRRIHYCERLKDVCSLFWEFSSSQFRHILTYTDLVHPTRTSQARFTDAISHILVHFTPRHTHIFTPNDTYPRSNHSSIHTNAINIFDQACSSLLLWAMWVIDILKWPKWLRVTSTRFRVVCFLRCIFARFQLSIPEKHDTT